jgi:hypothetical protein
MHKIGGSQGLILTDFASLYLYISLVSRKAFEPLFAKHGVDLYVGAHKHYYERLGGIGVDGSACTPPASTYAYVVHGSAGNNEGVQKKGTGKNADLVQGSDYAAQGFLEFELGWYFGI